MERNGMETEMPTNGSDERTVSTRTPPLSVKCESPPDVRRRIDVKPRDQSSTTTRSSDYLSPRTQLQKMKNKVREKSIRVSTISDYPAARPVNKEKDDMGWIEDVYSWTLDSDSATEDEPPEEERRVERLREFYETREDREENGRERHRLERSYDGSERGDKGGSDKEERGERPRSLERSGTTGERAEKTRSRGSFVERESGEKSERGERDRRDSDRTRDREERDKRERRSSASPAPKNLSPYRNQPQDDKDRRASVGGERPRSISRSGSDDRESTRDRGERDRESRDRKRREKAQDKERIERHRDKDKDKSHISSKLKRSGSSYIVREEGKSEDVKGGGSLIVGIDRDARSRDRTGSSSQRSPKSGEDERRNREDREGYRRTSLEDRKGVNVVREKDERERRDREEEARRRRDPFVELLMEVDSLWALDDLLEEPAIEEQLPTAENFLPPFKYSSGAISMPKSLLGHHLLLRRTDRNSSHPDSRESSVQP